MNDFFGFDGLRPNNPDLLYNERFLADSTFFLKKDDLDVEFQLFKKVIFEYDNQGRLLVENELENKDGFWKNFEKRFFNYDNDGYIDYRVSKQWNPTSQLYDNKQRTFFYRNFLDLVSAEIDEVFEDAEWIPESKLEYSYNEFNMISEELTFAWQAQSMDWQPERRKLYEYNANRELSSEVYQVWIDTMAVWENTSLKDYEYNDENQLVNMLQSSWSRGMEKWIQQSFQALSYTVLGQVENASFYDVLNDDSDAKESVEATYDEDGNLNTTLFNEWDPDQNDWESYEMHIHFWSKYVIGNLDRTNKDIECFYANPHTVGLPWYCNSLLKNETYVLSVFDQNGVLHHSQRIKGSDTFRLTKNLNNGLYLIVITGGLTVHTEKVLIRN